MKNEFSELCIGDEFWLFNKKNTWYGKERVTSLSEQNSGEILLTFHGGGVIVEKSRYSKQDESGGFYLTLLKSEWLEWVRDVINKDIEFKMAVQDKMEREISELKKLISEEK